MQNSNQAPTHSRTLLVVELGVLVTLGALLVLAIVVGPSKGADADPDPVGDSQEANAATSRDTGGPSTSDARMATPTTAADVTDEDSSTTDSLLAGDEATAPVPTSEPGTIAYVDGPFVDIEIGNAFACGLLRDRRVECWGAGWATESVPSEVRFASIDAGFSTVCGLDTDGQLVCWGFSDYLDPGNLHGPHTEVALGRGALCVLRFDGTILCSAGDSDVDVGFSEIDSTKFAAVAAGRRTICALDSNGAALCWAEGLTDSRLPTAAPPSGPFEEIYLDVDGFGACAIRADRTAACWGGHHYTSSESRQSQFAQLAIGVFHVCGVHMSGTIECWGDNWSGQTDAPDGEFVDVSAGAQHSCGVRKDGELLCWGHDWTGQTEAPSGAFVAVESWYDRNCAIRSDGTAVCWGQPY